MVFPKRWCFTLNNYTDDDVQLLENLDCQFLVFGREKAPSTGTPHLQGYVEFKKPMRRRTVVRALGGKCWVTQARGTAEESIEYCSKDDTSPFRKGAPGVPGKRSDLDTIRDRITDGTITNQWDLLFSVRSMTGFTLGAKLLAMCEPPDKPAPKVFWLYGSTGTGKSKAADEFSKRQKEKDWRTWRAFDPTFKWFDGYCGQQLAIFDDFRASGVPVGAVLTAFDRYVCQVQVKGGTTWWVPRVIIVTTPHGVVETFGSAGGVNPEFHNEDLTQLTRRVTKEFNFDEDGLDEWKECIVQYTE